MKNTKATLLSFITAFLFTLLSIAHAGQVTVFGQKEFVRTTGKPNIYEETFTAEPGEAWLVIRNGIEGPDTAHSNRVSSGVITLNETVLFSHDDFKHQTFILETPVSLLANNYLKIELHSTPGNFLSIDIIQTLPDPVVDLAASDILVDTLQCPDAVELSARLTNAGEAEIPGETHIAFYNGDPREEGILIGTATSTTPLTAGEFEDISVHWDNPPPGDATLYARAGDDGSGTTTYDELDLANNLIAVDAVLCEDNNPGGSGISGRVIDAVNGSFLVGAQTLLQADDNGQPGSILASIETDGEGYFVFHGLAAGSYFISSSSPGYIDNQRSVIVPEDTRVTERDLVLSPLLNDNEIRVILTWNSQPADLEAHLTEPNGSGCRYHCYYFNKTTPTASLDLDDRDGYGPETITITDKVDGIYRYYVHDFTNRYTNSRWLAMSGAVVKVYAGNRQPLVFTVPNSYGNTWHVFDLDGRTGEIIPVHIMARQSEPGRIDYPSISSSAPGTAYWNTPYSYQVRATDPDQDPLTFSLEQAPEGMTIDPASGLVEWTPSGSHSGRYYATVRVDDGRCGESTQTFSVYVYSQPTASFSVSPCSGQNPDGDITLSWSTKLAETVLIEPGIGEVATNGSLTIPSPDTPTVYTLTAYNDAALTKRTVPSSPYASFYFSPNRIYAGNSTNLYWTPHCSASSIIDHDIGPVTSAGSLPLVPTETTTYTLSLNNASRSRKYTATVYIIPPPPPPPPSATLTIAPTCNMTPGEPLTLTWSTNNATEITISPDLGTVEASGSRLVYPQGAGSYTLRATGDGGSISRTVSFPGYPGLSLYASPTYNIDLGDSVTLHWSSSCADTVTMNQGVGEVPASGSLTVTPDSLPKTYTLTAVNEKGSRSRSVTFYQIKPSGTLGADPAVLKVGGSTTLTWTSDRATSCTITPDVGPVDCKGSVMVTPAKPTSYTLTMTGPGGTIYRSVYVTFVSPIADLKASALTIDEGQSAQLSWIFANATTCTINQGIGSVDLGGQMTVTPLTTTTYTMTATGPGGTAIDRLTISVIPAVRPPAVSLSASDNIIQRGESTDLSWDSSYADAVVIEPGLGVMDKAGTATVSPAVTTSYTATATGDGGTATARATVTVLQPLPAFTLQASPVAITAGESAVLSWSSSNVDRITFNQGIGEVSQEGVLTVTPNATTTYSATAVGPGGTSTASVTVEVLHPSPAVSFSAVPPSIRPGESTILTWRTDNAATVVISPDIGTVGQSGQQQVSPGESTTYTLTATGPGGTATETVTVTIIYPEPVVSLTADPASIPSGKTSLLTWTAQYAEYCSIAPEVGTVDCTGTTTVTPLQDTTYTLTAVGPGGTATTDASIAVTAPDPLTLLITSPSPGDSLSRPSVQVTGTVHHRAGLEVGVTVNGVIALVDDDRFVANHVPIEEGENTLIARAVDMNGQEKEATVSFTAASGSRYIALYEAAQSGLAPMETTLRVNANFALPDQLDISSVGPGTVEFIEDADPASWTIRMSEAGIYYFTVEAQGENGEIYTDDVAIFAMDSTALDSLLKGKWDGMKAALVRGDMEAGLYSFLDRSRQKYRQIFTALADKMAIMAETMNPIEMIYYDDGIAKYRIKRTHDIDGTPVTITYYIYFTRDTDGLFKIYKF